MSTRARALLSGAAVLVGGVAHLVLQAGMMFSWAGWRPSYFRNYYWPDELTYLSIATNVSQGQSPNVEPFTLTGSNNYPRAWYVLLGLLARLTGTSPATMWTLCGLLVQLLVVVAVGTACVLLSRRWWTGVLGFVPFLLGTGAWMLSSGTSWMTTLDSHAVLWGPFGVLFTLNGEAAALSLGITALLAMLVVGAGRVPSRAVLPVALVACGLIGLLANVQTYAFLVVTYVLAAGVAAVGLLRERSRVAGWSTLGLFLLVVVAGPFVADLSGQLSVVFLGLAPTVPGVLLVLRSTRWRGLWCVAALGLGAATQVLATVWGLVIGDPFLTYREASSTHLGVPVGQGLFAALAVLPAIVTVVVLGIRRRHVVLTAAPLALVAMWAYLASNDRWGANQEPYRFWLDIYVVVAALTVPLVAWVAVRPPVPEGRSTAGRRSRVLTVGALVACTAVAAVWSWDFTLFHKQMTTAGYLPLTAPQYRAQADLLDRTRAEGGLVLLDGCTDPWVTNAIWGGPVAYYHVGLAWPDNRADIDAAVSARATGRLDQERAVRAGIRWLFVQPGCSVDLTAGVRGHVVGSTGYGGGTWNLWRLDD